MSTSDESTLLPLEHPRRWLVMGWSLVALSLTGFLLPPRDVELLGLHHVNDKFMHATAYAILFVWFAGLYPRSRYVLIASALLFMGIAVEWLQGAMAVGRSRDVMDLLANASGVVIGIVLALSLLGGWAYRVETWIKKS